MSAERRTRGSVAATLALAASIAAATSLHAEPSPADRATATALFKEARQLMEQQRYGEACRKFEESQRLDPGGGTLLNLATCHKAAGKTATAWSEFVEALGIARRDGRDERVKLAQDSIAALEPTLSTLRVVVPKSSDLPELEISRDGSLLGRAAWGTAIPVDPGEHVVRVSAAGRVAWKATLRVGAPNDAQTVTVPLLEPSTAPPVPVASTVATPPPSPPPQPTARPSPASPAQRTVGFSLVAVGAVGVAFGSYFGLRSLSKHHDSSGLCPTATTCSTAGAQLEDQARSAADGSTVAFAIGALAAAAGAYLILSSPDVSISPSATHGGGGVLARGNF